MLLFICDWSGNDKTIKTIKKENKILEESKKAWMESTFYSFTFSLQYHQSVH